VTRDTAGNTDTGGDEPWSSGLTGPQRAFPVWDGAPGYEFEGGRAARRPPPAGPAAPRPPSPPPPEAPRFRYTQTIGPPSSVFPAWDDQPVPGFEFDTPAQPVPRNAPRNAPRGTPQSPPQTPHSAPHNAPHRPGGAEWVRLLRSFLPEPVKRNWFAEFRSALHFRGAGARVIIPIVAMMVFGVAVAVIAGANGSPGGTAPPPDALGFPPATLAGNAFAAAATGRGISQTLSRVASYGAEIVAVGSQQGARIARAQFFVSADDGRTWAMGHVRSPDGAPPSPGYAARFVAGGPGGWVALGPSSIWTSPDGRTWTLVSTAGLPLRPGDQVNVLKRTATGFIAAGSAGGAPLIFLSGTGTTWQRLAPRLPGTTDIRYAAANGDQILVAGDAGRGASAAWLSGNGGTTWTQAGPTPAGHGAQAQITGLTVTANTFILFRAATLPAGKAAGKAAGEPTGKPAGKATAKPAAKPHPAVDVYRSANGTSWAFAATLAPRAGFTTDMVNGGPDGAVITGQSGPALIAFTSADGTSWRQTPAFGTAAAQDVSGVAVAQDGVVVAAGTTTGNPDSRQPLLTVLAAQKTQHVDITMIPGAADPELAVNDVAAGNGTQVAVGSANGYLAAWTSVNGGTTWTRAGGQTSAVLERPGVQQLTSVAFGADGWLAVGGVIAVAPTHPVVLTSGNGAMWATADNEPAFSQPGLVTEQAAADQNGYVIVGSQSDQSAGGRTTAAAWYAAGLTGWQRAAVASPHAQEQMHAVTAGPHGFVAVGADGNAAAAWTSPDGQSWTQQNVPLPYGAIRAVLQHVASNGRTVVAVGTALTTSGDQLPFAASSPDGGRTWAESALPVPQGRAFVTALTSIGTAAGTQYLATGTFGSSPGHQDVVVWTSASGSAWRAATPAGQGLTGNGIQAITALDVSDRTVTGVGFSAAPSGEQPVFWQSPIR
jgi:hypothetical protein